MSYVIDGVTLSEAQAQRLAEQVAERKRKPQPIPGQVYRHRETTDEKPYGDHWVLWRYDGAGRWSRKGDATSEWQGYPNEWPEEEVAKGRYVPYTPPVISNATHAGRRVQMHRTTGRVMNQSLKDRLSKAYQLGARDVWWMSDEGVCYNCMASELTLLD